MKEFKKRKTLILSILGVFILIVAIGGITFAFFNYTRTGVANTFSVGRISFTTNQTNTINLTNLFPINPAESGIMDDTTKVGTFTLTIQGDTDYTGGVEYLVSAVNSHVTTSTGQIVPISLDVDIDGLGDPSNTYFSARNSKNATIYKRLSGNGIMGDGMLLVGYIKPNTTSGEAEGVDGSITIKAYLDKNKIAISDTYNGNETDLMGTTNEWVNGRVVLTTEEWNALQNSGISFQVRVEANEGIWVEETLYDVIERQSVMDNIQSINVSSNTGIDFSKISGDTDNDGVIDNGEGVYTFSSTANDAYPVHYFRGAVTSNNVLFANKCWQMVRTTDTGGVKLIYNGENTGTSEAPACENTTSASKRITLKIEGTDTNKFAFNEYDNSPAYVGYMYGTVYSVTNGAYEVGSKFGNGVTWDGTNYTITNVSNSIDANHHYTCGTIGTITCSSIRYYFSNFTFSGTNYRFYFILSDGKSIESAMREMQTNTTDSNAKTMVDRWYDENIDNTIYESNLEDAIFCNDRSISNLGGLNPNGGVLTGNGSMLYSANARAYTTYNPSLSCRNNDAFTLPNGRGNGALSNPIGLITIDEIMLAGKDGALFSGGSYWFLTPAGFDAMGYATGFNIRMGALINRNISYSIGLRPVLSLKNGTVIEANGATGTASNPYIVK